LPGAAALNVSVEQLCEQRRFAVVSSRTAAAVYEHRDGNAPEWRVGVNDGADVISGAGTPVMVVSSSFRWEVRVHTHPATVNFARFIREWRQREHLCECIRLEDIARDQPVEHARNVFSRGSDDPRGTPSRMIAPANVHDVSIRRDFGAESRNASHQIVDLFKHGRSLQS
jgi:hypothetical protein